MTVDRQCGSSQQAVHFAAQAVLSGTAGLVVAGGVQNMSQIPIAAAMTAGQAFGHDDPFGGSDGWRARYGTGARLMTTLFYGLERTGGRIGLQTMCEGGGQANVTIIERIG